MRDTTSFDKTERDNWNAEANRHIKHWLIWTLLLAVVAYFLPLRWAVLLALFYARLADPVDLNLGNLLGDMPFAFPLSYLVRLPKRKTIYATSVAIKDESSGGTRARLHILENGDPALSLYSEKGDETAVFTSGSEIHEVEAFEAVDTSEAERRELEELREEFSQTKANFAGHSEMLRALSHDNRVLLEAVRRIDPSAIKTMEHIQSHDDAAQERYHDHAKGALHWSDYEPSVRGLESEILKVKATQIEIQARVALLEREE